MGRGSRGGGSLALPLRTLLGGAGWWWEAEGDAGPDCQAAPRALSRAGIPGDFLWAHLPPAPWPVAWEWGLWRREGATGGGLGLGWVGTECGIFIAVQSHPQTPGGSTKEAGRDWLMYLPTSNSVPGPCAPSTIPSCLDPELHRRLYSPGKKFWPHSPVSSVCVCESLSCV